MPCFLPLMTHDLVLRLVLVLVQLWPVLPPVALLRLAVRGVLLPQMALPVLGLVLVRLLSVLHLVALLRLVVRRLALPLALLVGALPPSFLSRNSRKAEQESSGMPLRALQDTYSYAYSFSPQPQKSRLFKVAADLHSLTRILRSLVSSGRR
jgi:hypothetical protein